MERLTSRLLLGAALIAAMSGCVNRQAQKEAKDTEKVLTSKTFPVSVETIEPRSVVQQLDITGTITTSSDSEVGASVGGRIIAVYVKDGDKVTAGQVLAQQEMADLDARRRQAQAQVDQANSALQQAVNESKEGPRKSAAAVQKSRARLSGAQAALLKLRNGSRTEEKAQAEGRVRTTRAAMEVAKNDMDRAKSLLDQGAISAKEFDQRRLAYTRALEDYNTALESQRLVNDPSRQEDIRQAEDLVRQAQQDLNSDLASQRLDVQYQERIRSAQAAVRSAEENLRLTYQALSDTKIRSPFTGKVNGKPVQPGVYAAPGTPIVHIIGSEGNYFEGDVPEVNISRVQMGQSVTVKVDAAGGASMAGTVVGINPTSQSLGRLYKVRIGIGALPAEVKNGMFARGMLEYGRTNDAITVPLNAIQSDTKGKYVYIVTAQSKAARVDIKVISEQENRAVVTGPSAGQQVITSGQNIIGEGTLVQVTSAKPAAQ